jgi:hypothetical protein
MRLTIRTYNNCEDSSFIPPESELIKKVKAGLNVFSEQRFKRPFENGEIVQEVNFNDFNYGISGYLSFLYLVTIHVKLETSPLFSNQVELLYNPSLGIRFGIN